MPLVRLIDKLLMNCSSWTMVIGAMCIISRITAEASAVVPASWKPETRSGWLCWILGIELDDTSNGLGFGV